MAKVSVVFGRWHGSKPILSKANQSENIDSSGTSQTSSNTGTTADDCVEVAASGGAVWITLDGTTAEEGTHFLIPDGSTRHFDAGLGTKVKVINA
jgi:hypothetical protein